MDDNKSIGRTIPGRPKSILKNAARVKACAFRRNKAHQAFFISLCELQDAVGHFIDEQNAVTMSALCMALGRSLEYRRQYEWESAAKE